MKRSTEIIASIAFGLLVTLAINVLGQTTVTMQPAANPTSAFSSVVFNNTNRILCRDTAGAGAGEECTSSAVLDISVRLSFWRDVVSPIVPTDQLEEALGHFERRTGGPLKEAGR